MALDFSAFGGTTIEKKDSLDFSAFSGYKTPSLPLVLSPQRLSQTPVDLRGSGPTFLRAPQATDVSLPNDIAGYKTGEPSVKVPFQNRILPPLFPQHEEFNQLNDFLNNSIKWIAELPEEAVNTAKDIFNGLQGKTAPTPINQPRVSTPISVAQDTFQQAVDGGHTETQAKVIGTLAGTWKFAIDFAPFYPIADESVRALVRQLPQELLQKVITTEIPAGEIRAALTGADGATGRASSFVKSLSNQERKDLFGVLRSAEKVGAPLSIQESAGKTPLGEYAKIEPTTPTFARTIPEQQLPGYRRVPRQAPAFGLSTEKVERVGGEIPKELQPLAEEARKYKSAEEFTSSLISNGTYADTLDLIESKTGLRGAGDFYNQVTKGVVPTTPKVSLDRTTPQPPQEANIPVQPTLLQPIISNSEVPSLAPIISEKTSDVKKKVNILDYLRTPETVLEKVGLGNEARMLRLADEGYKRDLANEIRYLQGLVKKVPTEQSSKNIFRALDGREVQLTPVEQEVTTELRTYLKNWADKLHLPEDARITNYITHIFDRDFIQKEFDPELAKLITDKVPGSVYDPFLLERLGKMGYKENVWQALDAYVKRGVRKVNFDPALQRLSEKANLLDLESFNYVKRYVASVNMRPTEIDNLIDNAIKSSPVGYKFGQRPTIALTTKFRQWIYRGSLGLNFGSAIKNLTQGVNTYAKLGAKYTVLGYIDMFRNFIGNGLRELTEVGVLNDNLIEDRTYSVTKRALQKLDKVLWSFFDFAEKVNRGAAYFGAKRQARNAGMTLEKSVEYGKKIVRQTQFTFGRVDTPVALSSDIVKTLAQFQTFNIKQGELLTNMLKNKEFAGLVRWLAASLAILFTVGKLFGMKPSDLVPTIRLGGSPLGNLMSGILDQLSSNEGVRALGRSRIKNTGYQFIPAGVQAKKTIQGLQAAPDGISNKIRGALFGKGTFPQKKKVSDGLIKIPSISIPKIEIPAIKL